MEQAQAAELWMFYGDWTFKGSKPMVELSDFYPSPDKLAPIIEARKAQGQIVLTPEQLRKIEGEAYKAGHSDGYRKGYREGRDKGPVVDALRSFLDDRFK